MRMLILWIVPLTAVAVLLAAVPQSANAQLVVQGLTGQQVVNPFAAGLGRFFDPNGPVPIFLDRPMTSFEMVQFQRGRLRVPANRPFTFDTLGPFDPFFGLGTDVTQTLPVSPLLGGQIIFSPGKDPGRFGHFAGPLHRPFVPNSTAPGIYWAPGRNPGVFGHFRGSVPNILPPNTK